MNQELVKTSNNPIELAHILDTESEFIPSDLLDAKENAIANVIGNKVSRNSFIQFDDANNITFSIARGYGLTNKGKTIDIIADLNAINANLTALHANSVSDATDLYNTVQKIDGIYFLLS